jgi:hypothetical protein
VNLPSRPTSILLDAQLLVLRVVGGASRAYIAKHKRLRDFLRLGLADAACLATDTVGATLLTADLALYLAAENAGRKVINFRHLREACG